MGSWLFVLVFLLSAPAWAATYHTAKTGSDGVSCAVAQNWTTGTPSLARLTINAGATCLSPGDTLLVHSGTYLENVQNPASGSAGAYKVIKAAPLETVWVPRIEFDQASPVAKYIEFDRINIDCDANGNDAYGVAGFQGCTSGQCAGFIRLRNMEVKNCWAEGVFGGGISSTPNLELINLNVHNNGFTGQSLTGPGAYLIGPGIVVDGGSYHHNAHDGIQFRLEGSGFSNVTVKNAAFHNNGVMGLRFNNFGSNTVAFNNRMYENGGAGLEVAASGIIYSNTITGNAQGGINCRTDSGSWTQDGKNNIIYASGTAFSQCTLGSIVYQATVTQNPGFVSAAGGDFNISSAGSPANVGGITLGGQYAVDAQNRPRPSGSYTIGAYQFAAGAPPSPGYVGWWKGNLNANDSIGTAHGTLTNGALANGAPIVEGNSFVFDGVNDYVIIPGSTPLRPAAFGVSLWVNTPTAPIDEACNVIRMGNAWSMGWLQDGRPFCWINFGPTAQLATGTVLNGTNQMLSCTYDPAASGAGVRLWLGTGQIAFTATSSPLTYSGTENLLIGGNVTGGFNCPTRVDSFRLGNFELQQADINALFAEVPPTLGVSQTHQRYSVANLPEGTWIGPEDTNQSILATTPFGIRWSLHNATGGPLTEYFRPFCRVNHLGVWGAWTELTNSFGSFGLRYLTDSAVNVGSPTTPVLPLDGFTGVPGKYLADVVDVTAPYDAAQKIAFANGEHAELEIRLEAASPVVVGDLIQCAPRHETGALLSGGYGGADVNIRTMTLAGATHAVRLGGATRGGMSR